MIRNSKRGRILYQSFIIYVVSSGIWTSCLAQGTIYVSGTITGNATWSADTVKVTGSVSADTLVIEPGTVVEFQGRYGLSVYKLFANGEMGDSILFTINDTTGFSDPDPQKGGWGGIFVYSKGLLNYCKIQYVKKNLLTVFTGAVTNLASLDVLNCSITNNYTNGICKEGPLNIRNSLIANNAGQGIKVEHCVLKVHDCIIRNNSQEGIFSRYGLLLVENSTIESNGNYGIYSIEPSSFSTKKNIIQNNRGTGVRLYSLESSLKGIFSNNIIRFNNGNGLMVDVSDVAVINNLITGNSNVGVDLNMGRGNGSTLINSTITNNSNGIDIGMTSINMYNCICRNNDKREGEQNIKIFDGGLTKIFNNNIEGFSDNNYGGEFLNNIDTDPQFIDTTNFDFHLSDYSPCINAGTSDTTGLNLPYSDLGGNPRVFDGRIDMGAFEYQQDNFHILTQPESKTVCEGVTVAFETEAIGGVIGYQWQRDGINIPSANLRILTFNNVSLANAGTYNCLIIADDKTVSSDVVELSVIKGVAIESQTTSFSICPERDTLLFINTISGNNVNYQWYKNNQIIAGEINPILEITSHETQHQDRFYCIVSDNCKSIQSQSIEVNTYAHPSPPVVNNIEICEGSQIPDFVATGDDIKWYSDEETMDFISSGNTYKPKVQQPGIYSYYVTQSQLNCPSPAAKATITIKSKPIILMADSYSACKNEIIAVSAGSGFSSYTWSNGATSESITVTQPGWYQVTVVAQNGCSTSKTTEIIFFELPEVELGGPYSVCKGTELLLDAGFGFSDYLWSTGERTETIIVSESAIYNVTVIDKNDCSNSDYTTVTINDLPQLQLPNDTTLSMDDTLRLDAGSGYQSYLWSTGSNDQVIFIYGEDPGIYTYTAEVTDYNDCSATDDIVVTVSAISAMFENPDNIGIKVYPNPSRSILNIKSTKNIDEAVMIRILDNSGKTLYQLELEMLQNDTEYQIDISDFQYGDYYLQISNKKLLRVEKIIIK